MNNFAIVLHQLESCVNNVRGRLCNIVLGLVFVIGGQAAAGELAVDTERGRGMLSENVVGIHFVYNDEKDSIYADSSVAKWAREAGIGTGRFPGGNSIKYWDWKNPSGYQKVDPWDPEAPPQVDPSQWMSLDEYLRFVDESGIKPIVGINIVSGYLYARQQESIQRAVEQVKYILLKGYRGAYYYLGNEDFGPAYFDGIENAARAFVAHAKEIKRVDPDAKLFWNDNHVNSKRLKRFLKIAGHYADGVEFHSKWPYSGKSRNYPVDIAFWQQQYPIKTDPHGRYSDTADELRLTAAMIGYPDLLLANNEYGVSQKFRDRLIGFDRYTYSLVVIEMLQDLFVGRVETSAFWSNVAASKPGGTDREKKRLIDTASGNRLNPMHFGFELLSAAHGKELLEVEGGSPSAYGFAARDDSTIHIFLLNKTNERNSISIDLRGNSDRISMVNVKSLVDTEDHWGKVVDLPAVHTKDDVRLILPSLSYSRISITLSD